MAKNNLKDKTKIVLNDSKAILAKATSIRKEYDKLFEILRIQAKPYGLIETRTNDKPMIDINRDTQNEYLQKAILHSERSYVFDLDPDAKETPKNRKYVQKAIYPDATVSSLKIILLNFLKKDERVVLYFIHELYRFDIILTANLIMDVQQEKRELLMDAFKFLIKNDQTSDRYIEKLLASSIIRDVNFFTELVDKCDYIDAKKVNSLFSNTKWNDETFLLLLYANTIRKTVSKSEVFYTLAYKAFISCNCSNFQISDGTLSEFMQSALKEKDYKIISKMITVLGIEYIDNHYSNGFLNELKMDIFADKVPFVLQFEYIKMLARSDEYISNMNDLYSLFEKIQSERKAFFTDYLYIAEVAKENQNISIFRDHLEPLNVKFVSKYDDYEIMYKKAISVLWEKPYKLKEFLETTEMCNPYVIKTKSAYYTANRELVDSSFYQIRDLFYMDVDIDAILFIYLKTYIHRDVPMEYLFDIAYMHGHIKELIEVTSSYEFSGMVYSINESHHLVIRPVEYYSFGYYENTTPYIWTYEPALYGVSVRNYLTYNIINYRNGHFDFGNIKLENLSDDAEQKWYELLSVIKVILTSGIMNDIDKQLLNHYSDFSPGLFFKRIELDDLLQLFHAFVDRSELFLPIINELCWNRSICCCEQLPTIFFGEMKKYREKAYELFVQMQLLHMSDEFGIELYIKTFFKTIIPLPNMLLLYQVEKAIPILRNYPFHVTVDQRNNKHLSGISCPTQMISIRNDIDISENDNVICCNYEIKNNYVIKIDFEMMTAPAEENAVVKIDRGYSFYTYIKNNKNLSQNRRDQLTHMLPLSQIIWDKPVFFYQSLVDAIHIRRAEIWRQVTLINTLKAYNPFYHVQGNMPYLIYYYKYYNKDLKHVVQNEIINVVLNMRTIEDVEHIYLHSHYKYYVSVNELVKIIKERRPELLPFTFNIFSNESLVCIIDREGNIINSFFDQESVHLSQINHSANEYIVYMCSFSVEPDGIKVKNCENVDSFYQALTCIISCIISGKVNMEKAIGLFEGILNELFSKNGLTELVKECNLFPKTSIILHDLLITIRNMDQLNKKIENIDWKKIFHALRYLSQVDDLSSEEEICTVLWNLLSKEEVRGENKSNDTKDDIVQTVKKEKADNQFMNQLKVHEIQRKQELYCIEKERFVIRPNKSILNILRLKPRTLNLINAYKRIANSLDNDIDFHLEEDNELLLSCFSKDPRFFISCYRKAFLIRMNNIMLIMDLIEKTKEISPFYSTDRCDDYICGCALFAEIAEKYAICEEFKEVIKAASNFNDILYIYIHSFYKYSMTVDKLLKAVKSLRTDMVLDSAPCFDNAIFPFITDGERRLRSPSFSSFYLDNAVMVEPLHLYYASFSIRNGNYTCISHEPVDNVTVLFIAICVCIANQPSEVDSLLSIMKEMGDSLEERSQMQMNEISMLPISLPLIRKTCNMVKEFGGKNIEKSIKWNKIRKEFTKQDETRIIKLIDLPRKFQQVNTDIGFLVGELIGLSNNCTVLDDVGKMLEDNQIKQTRKMTLKEMKLSDDTCDVLSNAGFSFSSEIINMSTKELVSIPHIEIESVVEIQNWKKNQKKEQRNTTYAKINTGLTPNDYFWIDPDFFFDLFEQSMHIRTNDYRYQRQYIEYLDVQNIFTYSRIFWNYQMHYVGVMDRTKKEGIIDDFIRILGSISSVEQIVEIYMNSHYKFYFSINELKDLINRYRNDLCPYNISSFQVYGFFGVVDNRGVLWNPFFSPETLRIGKAACGTVYLFRVRVTSNEIVIANQEEINCAVYGLVIVLSCLCLGWNISDSTRDLLRLLSNSVFTGSTVYDGFKPYLEPIDCDTIITRANELYNLADISPQIPISLFERYRNTKETLKRRKL